ncbi:hypothetical protein ACTXT7_013820 [Hymenolepis weldensis]
MAFKHEGCLLIKEVAVQGSREHTQLAIRGSSAGQLPSVVEGGGASGWTAAEGCRLRPQENFNAVIQHDLKEMGANTLLCSVSYVVRLPVSALQEAIMGPGGVQLPSGPLVTEITVPKANIAIPLVL